MATITALLDAIYTKYDGDTNLKAELTGGLWHVEAEQETVMPYGTYAILPSAPEYDFGDTTPVEIISVQFNIYVDKNQSDASLKSAYDDLVTLFDECSLTVTGHSFMRMHRVNNFFDKDDESNWRAVIEYEVMLERSS